jgi:hypothetical protein
VQNAVASASVASSPAPIFALALVKALSSADVVGAGLKAKLNDYGLFLIDNTQSEFPVAVSSLSSLSSKAPITNPARACRSFQRKLNSPRIKSHLTIAKCRGEA